MLAKKKILIYFLKFNSTLNIMYPNLNKIEGLLQVHVEIASDKDSETFNKFCLHIFSKTLLRMSLVNNKTIVLLAFVPQL